MHELPSIVCCQFCGDMMGWDFLERKWICINCDTKENEL